MIVEEDEVSAPVQAAVGVEKRKENSERREENNKNLKQSKVVVVEGNQQEQQGQQGATMPSFGGNGLQRKMPNF